VTGVTSWPLLVHIASATARCGLLLRSVVCRWVDDFAKTAERIEMPFGIDLRACARETMYRRVHIGATRRIRLNEPCSEATRAVAIYLGPPPTRRSTLCTSGFVDDAMFSHNGRSYATRIIVRYARSDSAGAALGAKSVVYDCLVKHCFQVKISARRCCPSLGVLTTDC